MCPNREEGATVWEDFLKDPNEEELRGLFNVATALLRQATLAFDAGAHPGASLLCRSALEAVLFVFMTREQRDQPAGAWYVVPPETLAGETRIVRFQELIEAARKGKVLPPRDLDSLARIQEHGNVVAHLGARADEVQSGYGKRRAPRLWIGEEEAREDLRDTVRILKRLARITKEEPDKLGPQHRERIIRVQRWFRLRGRKKDSDC